MVHARALLEPHARKGEREEELQACARARDDERRKAQETMELHARAQLAAAGEHARRAVEEARQQAAAEVVQVRGQVGREVIGGVALRGPAAARHG